MTVVARPFGRYLSALVSNGLSADTVEPGGLAPGCAVLRAPNGYGEEVWLDAIDITTLAFGLVGGESNRVCWGPFEGRIGPPGRSFALQPRGTPNHYICAIPFEFGKIFLPDAMIDRYALELRGRPLAGVLRPDLVFLDDADFEMLMRRYVMRCHDTVEPATRVEVEALGGLIIERLITRYHPPGALPPLSGGLASWRLRRSIEQLENDLVGDLSLAELADDVGLSPAHFSRAFKASTGLPPHQWLIARRINKSKHLLARSRHSLSEVALRCGFASQQHFTTAFKRHIGTTPAAFRRECAR